jgi:formylglycine-generating enzyme required for sulfatase activity
LCEFGECVVDNTPGELVWIKLPGGAFEMGCVADGYQCGSDEQPLHTVILQGFRILDTEVTEGQYEAVMGVNPSWNQLGVDFPVESVDWYEAKEFCEAVGGSLPTEAEWEYAARAGATTKFYCGDDEACLDGIAWTADNADGKQPVKGRAPNDFGLYDMTGNLWEWTADWLGDYMEGPVDNPVGPGDGLYKVTRGGSVAETGVQGWHRLSERHPIDPATDSTFLGFRCVKGLEQWELED